MVTIMKIKVFAVFQASICKLLFMSILTLPALLKGEDCLNNPLFPCVMDLKEENQQELLNSPNPLVLMVYADWCPACQRFKPFLESLCQEFSDVRFAKLNYDKEYRLAHPFHLSYLPTFIFLYHEAVFYQIDDVYTLEDLKARIREFREETSLLQQEEKG